MELTSLPWHQLSLQFNVTPSLSSTDWNPGTHGWSTASAAGDDITNNSTLGAASVGPSAPQDRFLPWDNPWNIISYRTSRQIVSSVAFYVFPIIFLVGVPTNVINCVVFFKQGLSERMNLCLMWLAVTDVSYLLCETASVAHSYLALSRPLFAKEYEVKRLSYVTGVTLALMTTSGCISTLIAVERCIVVVFPLKAHNLMSTRTMAAILSAITILLQLGFSLFPLTMQPLLIVTNSPTKGRTTQWVLAPTRGPNKDLIFSLFQHVVDGFLQFALPLMTGLVVVVCTLVTVVNLRVALAWRKGVVSGGGSKGPRPPSPSSHHPAVGSDGGGGRDGGAGGDGRGSSMDKEAKWGQVSLTRMLVLISCLYIVCSTPGLMLALWRRADTEFGPGGRYSNMFYATHIIAYQVFTVSNSSLNFFVYYCRSSRYRRVLHQLVSCCRAGKSAAG